MKNKDSFIIYMEQKDIEVYGRSRLSRKSFAAKEDPRWLFCLEHYYEGWAVRIGGGYLVMYKH